MVLKREIVLSDELMERCRAYGEGAVRAYAEGRNARSHALSSHGADTNPELWATAKGGEAAFAIWANVNPDAGVDWVNRADGGTDVRAYGLNWDVKTIAHNYRYLCWPVRKNDIYFKKNFHMLVLVKARPPVFSIERWMTKLAFFCEKQRADGRNPPGLTEGTWCVLDDRAWPMDKLFSWLDAKETA